MGYVQFHEKNDITPSKMRQQHYKGYRNIFIKWGVHDIKI